MAAAGINQFLCMTDDCRDEAAIYCKKCMHMFCETHNQDHKAFQKLLKIQHDVQTAEEYRNQTEDNSQYCVKHHEYAVEMACEFCYRSMCQKCVHDVSTKLVSNECPSDSQEFHQIGTIELVVKKVEYDLEGLLNELKVLEIKAGDDMKERKRVYDEQLEENRTDLEKLSEKIRELHEMLDDFEKETKETLILHMNSKKEMMMRCEREFEEYQKRHRDIHEKTTQFLKLNNSAVVKDHQKRKEEMNSLIQYQMNKNPEQSMQYSLIIKDESLHLPISLLVERSHKKTGHVSPLRLKTTTTRKPLRLKFKQDVCKVPPLSGKYCRTVCYVQKGRLVHSGEKYPVTGLEFTPILPTGVASSNYSLYEHKSSLYLLHYSNRTYHVNVISLINQTVERSIINYPGAPLHQQIAVNDEYIIITDKTSKSAKVYSTRNYNHMFDMEHNAIGSSPFGLAFLDDKIIVGDFHNKQVSLMTISENPDIIWMCSELAKPTAIVVCDDSQIILVTSNIEEQIYILSYTGEKLSALTVPECGPYNLYTDGVAIYRDQLALACGAEGVKTYDIMYEEE